MTPKSDSEWCSFLAETALNLVEHKGGEGIYRFIGEQLLRIAGDAIIGVNTYDGDSGLLRTRALLGLNDLKDEIAKTFKKSPYGMTYRLNEYAYRGLITGMLHEIPGGLYDACLGEIPPDVCRSFERMSGVQHVYSIGFAWKGNCTATPPFSCGEARKSRTAW